VLAHADHIPESAVQMYGQTVIGRRARCYVIRSGPFLAQGLGGQTWGKRLNRPLPGRLRLGYRCSSHRLPGEPRRVIGQAAPVKVPS
jgi:hypothetical protein